MIGDHKQLRPFVNYDLSVEKGEGYDLNRSMFERLVLKGYPHQVLAQQHRMRPEISNLPRQLTYPDLIDAPKTLNRPDLRGFSNNVIFVDHKHPEDTASEDPETVNLIASKRNTFEAEMAFNTVKYLLQQGYPASDLVVLTPYLGQVKKSQEVFSREFDAVLSNSDIQRMEQNGIIKDSSEVENSPQEAEDDPAPAAFDADRFAFAELLEASSAGADTGVTHAPASKLPAATQTSAKVASSTNAPKAKPKIQVSTIGRCRATCVVSTANSHITDNYQGQESDIVVASLTRSNPEGDIGFLNSPERLNVLLSRARNALIIIGNSSTFKAAPTGRETWTKLFELLEDGGHMYQGVPVKCENHPQNTALLQTPADFAERCPNGGCLEPCGVKLRCGVHECDSLCHHLGDHSMVLCHAIIEEMCNRGKHVQKFECHQRLDVISKPCEVCQAEDEAERKKKEAEDKSGGVSK